MALTGKERETKLLKDATFIFIKNHGKELPEELNYWGIQNTVYMNELKAHSQEILDKHKRSSFAKKFIPSIIEQFDQKGYISKVQSGYVRGYIEEIADDIAQIDSIIRDLKAQIFTEIQNNYKDQIMKYIDEATQQYEMYRQQCRQNAAWEYRHGYRR